MLRESELLKIDTRQGTNNQSSFSHGNCLPYTGVPFGMNHFVAQTTAERGSWFFNPHDRTFQGFRLTHQPSPWMGDFSSMLFTPFSGTLRDGKLFHTQSSYRTEEAVFAPHYTKIKQERYLLTTELVPTTYGAVLRSQYHGREANGILISSTGPYALTFDPETQELSGHVTNYCGAEDPNFKMYFRFKVTGEIDFSKTGAYVAEEFQVGTDFSGEDLSFVLALQETSVNEFRLATSFIDDAQAQLNLSRFATESFATLKTAASEAWLNYLNRIQVDDRDLEKVATFYASLYRTALFPQKFYELDASGTARHYDTLSKTVKEGKLYTNNGFWDTYKTVYPLYSLIAEKEYAEMLEGFLNSYRNSGYLPKWLSPDERGLMPGTLVDAVIADAAVKGIAMDLMPEFLTAMEKAAKVQSPHPHYGRRGTDQYNELGYVSSGYGESVNHTQDYAYSDFSIAQVARVLGDEEKATTYYERSRNYQHIFDPSVGFMRAKDDKGDFVSDFDPLYWGKHYTEGSAWQNSFAVFHDFAGLIALHGGDTAFLEKLIELCNTYPAFKDFGYGFEIHEMSEVAAVNFGQVGMSNQPSFHIPYLFNYVNQPAYTQLLVKNIRDHLFNSGWDGFPGDEDNGSMAAWYIFSSLGFYPVTPGSGEYVIGLPNFAEATVHLSNGKELQISARNYSETHGFVKEVKRGEGVVPPLAIAHADLMTGGDLVFEMGLVPPLPTTDNLTLPFSIE